MVHTFKKCRSSHQRNYVKKLLLKVWQYLQENIFVGDSFQFRILQNFLEKHFLGTSASENVRETEKS